MAAGAETEDATETGADARPRGVVPVKSMRLDFPVHLESGTMAIRYSVGEADAPVKMMIYDVAGRLIRMLSDEFQTPGDYTIEWDRRDDFGRSVAAGVYVLRIQSGERATFRKMVVAR